MILFVVLNFWVVIEVLRLFLENPFPECVLLEFFLRITGCHTVHLPKLMGIHFIDLQVKEHYKKLDAYNELVMLNI